MVRLVVMASSDHCHNTKLQETTGICTCSSQQQYLRCAGATLPMFAIIFGDIINALGGSPTVAQLVHQVNKVDLLSCTPP